MGVWLGMLMGVTLGQTTLPADTQVILFPSVAAQTDSGQWVVPVHGWAFRSVIDERQLWLWEKLFQLDEELSRSERENMRRRLSMFLVDNLAGVEVEVSVGGERVKCRPAAMNGHFFGEMALTPEAMRNATKDGASELIIHTVAVDGEPETSSGRAHLVKPMGVSVICDIDDTIRATGVGDHEKLFESTFLDKFKAVSGMPGLLRHWKRKLGAEFHYVSVCPWQFYPDLEPFFAKERIPPGSFHLKSVRLKDRSFMTLFAAPDEHKNGVIEELLARYPRRQFVLVGDASERDPEIYGRYAREHSAQIALVIIRDAAWRHEKERYRAAFASVPETKYRIFRDPGEVRDVPLRLPMLTSQPR